MVLTSFREIVRRVRCPSFYLCCACYCSQPIVVPCHDEDVLPVSRKPPRVAHDAVHHLWWHGVDAEPRASSLCSAPSAKLPSAHQRLMAPCGGYSADTRAFDGIRVALQETKHTAYTVLSYPVRASHPKPDGLSPQSSPPAGGQPTLCHGSAGMSSAAAGLHSPSVHDPQTTAGPQAFFILPPAVRTRFPLKRVPAHVPGTACGFRVHVLSVRATEVAVAVAVATA